MSAEALTCPQCSAKLDPPPDRTQFFCQFCGATVVVPKESLTVELGDSAKGESKPLQKPVDLSGFQIDKQGDDLYITYTWSRLGGCFLLVFALGWNAFVTFFISTILNDNNAPKPMLLFMLPFAGVGLLVAYMALAYLVNRTEIAVHDHVLRIWNGPLPWKNPKPVEVSAIEQLFVYQKVMQGKYGPSYSYELQVLQHDGPVLKLITGEQSPDRVRAIERMLEVHLDIEDVRVEDEHG